MKVLLCSKCSDVRALRVAERVECQCGKTRARYRDEKTAVAELVGGDHSFILGLANDSLTHALRSELEDRAASEKSDIGHEFRAFVTPNEQYRRADASALIWPPQ